MSCKILVVDDERLMVDAYVRILGRRGHDIVAAASGEEALQILEKTCFDVVVLDFMLPGMNGLEVARKIKDMGIRVGIVMVTGTRVEDIECDGFGIWSLLSKNDVDRCLLEKVDEACEFAHLSPEREEALERELEHENDRIGAMTRDLMEETGPIPRVKDV